MRVLRGVVKAKLTIMIGHEFDRVAYGLCKDGGGVGREGVRVPQGRNEEGRSDICRHGQTITEARLQGERSVADNEAQTRRVRRIILPCVPCGARNGRREAGRYLAIRRLSASLP